jgi:hypothetical protein
MFPGPSTFRRQLHWGSRATSNEDGGDEPIDYGPLKQRGPYWLFQQEGRHDKSYETRNAQQHKHKWQTTPDGEHAQNRPQPKQRHQKDRQSQTDDFQHYRRSAFVKSPLSVWERASVRENEGEFLTGLR